MTETRIGLEQREFVARFTIPEGWENFGQGDRHGSYIREWCSDDNKGNRRVLQLAVTLQEEQVYLVEIGIGILDPADRGNWVQYLIWDRECPRELILLDLDFPKMVQERLEDATQLFEFLESNNV